MRPPRQRRVESSPAPIGSPADPPLIRGPRPRDRGYVTSTWAHQMRLVDRDYTAGAHWGQAGAHIDLVLDRSDTRVWVCYRPDDVDAIRGWLIYANLPTIRVVHFVFVREQERRHGVGTALLAHIGIRRDTECVTTGAGPQTALMRSKYPHAAQMPLARFLGVSAIP